MRWLRFVACAGIALSFVVGARPAAAAMMHHADLTSLALDAEVIVRARPVSERKESEWETVHSLRVTRTYKGGLTPGASFDVSWDSYSMQPFEVMWGNADAGAAPLGDEMIFFLTRAKAPDGGLGAYWILPSGLRIFLGGKAQRFEQWNNPGGYVPVPQRRDPFDLYGDPRGGEPLDMEGLEVEIARAMKRADEVTAALAAPDGPDARLRLVALAGPEPGDAPAAGAWGGGFYANGVARRIVAALAARGDLPMLLDTLARSTGVETFGLDAKFGVLRILDVAADAKQPLPRRLAAVGLAEGKWYEMRREPAAEARVTALLSDAAREVRMAALDLHPTEKPSERYKNALVARWKAETDDGVRIVLVHAAEAYEMRSTLAAARTVPMPLVVATRQRDVVHVAWADLDTKVNWAAKRATAKATRAGEPPRTLDLFARGSHSNGTSGFVTSRLAFGPFGAPGSGDVAISVDVVLEDFVTHRADVTRQFELGRVDAALVSAPKPERERLGIDNVADAAAPSGAPTVSSSAAPSRAASGAVPTAPRRGCGCEATPARPSESAWVCLVALALVGRRTARGRVEHVRGTAP